MTIEMRSVVLIQGQSDTTLELQTRTRTHYFSNIRLVNISMRKKTIVQ